MSLFKEMKAMVRENYSNASKHFDGEFKILSVEGYVKRKERIFNKINYKPPYYNKKVEEMLNLMLKNNKNNKLYESINSKPKEEFNIDNEISDIFKKEKRVIKVKPLPLEKVKKINQMKTASDRGDRSYNPNYNSIMPHLPVCTIRPITKNSKRLKLKKLMMCSKYNKHLLNLTTCDSSVNIHTEKSRNILLQKENKSTSRSTLLTKKISYNTNVTSNYTTIQSQIINK